MPYAVVENGIIVNVVEADANTAEWFGFVEISDRAKIGDKYNRNTIPHTDTPLELAQQEITDRELDTIEQGQQMTDLELLSITQNQAINVMTGGNLNDNL